MMEAFHIAQMKHTDWPVVSQIYQEGIETDMATFEQDIPEWDFWDEHHVKSCRLVAKKSEKIFGWAALSAVSSRCVYGGVAEVSV